MTKLISTVKAVILGSLENYVGSHIHYADQDTAGQGEVTRLHNRIEDAKTGKLLMDIGSSDQE